MKASMDCSVGNPINAATGAKRNVDVDYVGPGIFPVKVVRSYYFKTLPMAMPGLQAQAIDAATGETVLRDSPIFVYRQLARHNYDMRVIRIPNTDDNGERFKITRPDGRAFTYSVANNQIARNEAVPERLLAVGSVTTPTGYTFQNLDNTTENYDADGRLLSITDRLGLKLVFTYQNGNLISATDPFGHKITYTYDGDRWTGFTDPAGNKYSYGYLQYGLPATGTAPARQLKGEEIINAITYPDGNKKQYLFEDERFWYAMTGIIDENGKRYATYKYDQLGRAISSEHAGGMNKFTVEYDPNQTTADIQWWGGTITNKITNPLGLVSTREYSYWGGFFIPTRITENGYSWTASYSTASRPQVETDFRGQRVEYEYTSDGRNLLKSVRRGIYPDFKYTSYEWHPLMNLPAKVIEANRTTSYTYYDQEPLVGALKTFTVTDLNTKAERSWSYTYNQYGQITSETAPGNLVTNYGYNSKFELTSIKDPAGKVTTIGDYTANGLPQTIVNPSGLTTKLTYDVRDRIKTRTVMGEVTKFDYAKTGQIERVTRPDGSWTQYRYDDAHYLSSISDSAGNQITYQRDLMGNVLTETRIDPKGQLASDISQIQQDMQALPSAAAEDTSPVSE